MADYCFEVARSDLAKHRLTALPPPDSLALQPGQALLTVEEFALTANNITYGVAGDLIGYWQFFPTADGYGRIPVWGVGRVAKTTGAGVAEGQRYYGYFPMASYLLTAPAKTSPKGFADGAKHRQPLPPVYNQYALVSEANGFPEATLGHQMVYRPLFTTSFVLDDYLADNNHFGARRVILSSASSKTAFGLAHLLHERGGITVCGLTSAKNLAFVKSLGLYDEALPYQDLAQLDPQEKAAFVDMAGNRQVLAQLHHHYGERLVCSAGVGITHWQARDGEDPASLPGAKPTMFFAPDQVRKRTQDWGAEKFQQALATAWNRFLGKVDAWVTLNRHTGPAALAATYEALLTGAGAAADPAQAHLHRL